MDIYPYGGNNKGSLRTIGLVGLTALISVILSVSLYSLFQKASGWARSVKRHWDEDTRENCPLKVVLLGSVPLLIQRGLTENLAGGCEVSHWRDHNRGVEFVAEGRPESNFDRA
jgi:hypothetical protein